jgi:hypothetical protein
MFQARGFLHALNRDAAASRNRELARHLPPQL